jgi:hypothetical protein
MLGLLITDQYRKEQEALHAKGNYGTASLGYGQTISALVEATGSQTLLDYGCGSMQNLLKVLDCDVRYLGYDPAIPPFSVKEPCDFVACIDVLEHIEPELLDNVLDDLLMLVGKWGFFTVHTGPAKKTLSDGRNAHLIQKPASWWLPKILQRWDLQKFDATSSGFNVLVRAK